MPGNQKRYAVLHFLGAGPHLQGLEQRVSFVSMCWVSTGLFSARDSRAERLRDLIVDLAPPSAGQARLQEAEATEPTAESSVQQSGLNAEQQDAVKRYCSLLMPCNCIQPFSRECLSIRIY